MLFSFYLVLFIANDCYGTTHGSWFHCKELGCCFYMNSNKVFIFVIWSMSFRNLLKSAKLVSYCYHILISNISFGEWGSVISWNFNCLSYFCTDSDKHLEETPTKEFSFYIHHQNHYWKFIGVYINEIYN